MAINARVTGLENVEVMIDRAEEKLLELRNALNDINAALRSVGLEIGQPEGGTDR